MPTEPRSDSYVRTDFLERLAHDLRGPAGVTFGALDQLERTVASRAPESLPEALVAQLAMARRGVNRVLRIADRLERTAQLERGDTLFSMVACDLRGLVDSAARTAKLSDARKRIQLEVMASDEPCVAAIDSAWLLCAIGEIVGNAIHFARTTVSVDTRAHEHEVRITVRDDGPGFSKPPLLDRFEVSAHRSGTGLSLPLVHEVLEAHGGRLEISPPDPAGASGGTTVILGLPLLGTHA